MIEVILVEPETAGNIGAICRVMKNFELEKLVLINPKIRKIKTNKEAVKRAKHATEILRQSQLKKIAYLEQLDLVIGTTAKTGTDYNISRTPITAEQLSKKVKAVKNKNLKIGIVFGREGEGLSNEEIEKCDFIATIPTSEKYAAMNISHAAAIVFYELFKEKGSKGVKEKFPEATIKEKQAALMYINRILDRLEFSTKEKKQNQKKLWKRAIGKAMLSKREIYAMCGFFRKILRKK